MSYVFYQITNKISKKIKLSNNIRFIFKEQDCPRLPDSEGVSVPLVSSGKELSQIFFDIRTADALFWNNVNILHDDTFGDVL